MTDGTASTCKPEKLRRRAYLCHERQGAPEIRRATLATVFAVFEVAINAKVIRVEGKALERWIPKQRGELKGPKGILLSRTPMLDRVNPTASRPSSLAGMW